MTRVAFLTLLVYAALGATLLISASADPTLLFSASADPTAMPYMTATCTGRIEAPGKLCQFRVFQDPEIFLAVAVEGEYMPESWTPFIIDGDLLVWGIDWTTGVLPCRDVEIAEVRLLTYNSFDPIQAIQLHSCCTVLPEVFK